MADDSSPGALAVQIQGLDRRLADGFLSIREDFARVTGEISHLKEKMVRMEVQLEGVRWKLILVAAGAATGGGGLTALISSFMKGAA